MQNKKKENIDQRNYKRLGALPLADLSKDKAEQVDPIKGKKNPFWKHHLRNRPPSQVRRSTKDWFNHLEVVHIITTNPLTKTCLQNQRTLRTTNISPNHKPNGKNLSLSSEKYGARYSHQL